MIGTFYDFVHTFATAGSKEIPVPKGSGVMLNRVSEENAVITANVFKGGDFDLLPGQANNVEFEKVKITTDTACTVRVRLAQEGYILAPPSPDFNATLSANAGAISKPGAVAGGVTDQVITNGTEAQVIAGNTGRKNVWLFRVDTGTGSVRFDIQASTLGASQGGVLHEKGAINLETIGAVRVKNDSGASVTIGIIEEGAQ